MNCDIFCLFVCPKILLGCDCNSICAPYFWIKVSRTGYIPGSNILLLFSAYRYHTLIRDKKK